MGRAKHRRPAQVWDHVLSNPPAFWPLVVVAWLLTHRRAILAAGGAAACRPLSGRPPPVDTTRLLRRAYAALDATPPELLDCEPFAPLRVVVGAYAPFEAFPERAVVAHRGERARLETAARGVRAREQSLEQLQARVGPACAVATNHACLGFTLFERVRGCRRAASSWRRRRRRCWRSAARWRRRRRSGARRWWRWRRR